VKKDTANPGKVIKTYRNAKGIKLREMAVELGITLQQYQRYESWDTPPPFERLEKIIRILAIPPAKLFRTGKAEDGMVLFDKRVKKYWKNLKLIEDNPRLLKIIKAYGKEFK
jgi:transcriptional regulator with XRE-family HTH domain